MTEAARRPTPWPIEFYRSAVGKKWIMAVTGVMLLGFVLAHMVGNLKIYLGAEEFNAYGEGLREFGAPFFPRTILLWIMRIGLSVAFVLHIHAAYALTMMNRRARPVAYQSRRDYVAANYAARTMRWSGVIVGLYLLFHLADLTWGLNFANPHFVRGMPYQNEVASLSRLPVALIYLVANIALGFHIYHGAWSMFQSLGINNPRINRARKLFAQAFAAAIVLGNVSFPLSIQLGLVSQETHHSRALPAPSDHTAAFDRLSGRLGE
ncbi:MAG: succinate dehydrogenase cytochrome b subunit [Dehalococcoidia bacterium]